ncbi:MAG: hypothetical protein LBT55_02565 [Clostridiaceae bacterium]|jgi:pimeloyl-ACP methyl ester carboxylesterase|nr:hypothetical protein [Clostridiaceae bacterium]
MSKNRRFIFKLLAAALVVGLSGAGVILFTSCTAKERKAIIFIPALTASGLYDTITGKPVWDPLPYDLYYDELMGEDVEMSNMLARILQTDKQPGEERTGENLLVLIGNILSNSPNSLIRQISLDQYGVAENNPNLAPANGYDNKIQYGVLGAYKKEYDELKTIYGDEYDVHIFNYDWRMDNRVSSALLEEFINENGYNEVILISHSMGGNVAAGYLARSAENRAKVKAYLPYAASFLGSFDALMYLDNPMAAFDYISGFLGDSDVPFITELLTSPGVKSQVENLLWNMTSLIQLLPTYEFLTSDQYADGAAGLYLDGVPIASKDALYEFYSSRFWSYLRDADGNIATDANGNSMQKDVVKTLRAFHDSLYVTLDDGSRVFASTLVNTYYFVSNGSATHDAYYVAAADLPSQGVPAPRYASNSNLTTSRSGDGIVPYFSALAGQSVSKIAENHLFDDYTAGHADTGCLWSVMRDHTLEVLKEVTGY